MPTNDFLAIAKSVGANVKTQAEYAALADLLNNGMSSGVVDAKTFNKIIRQTTLAAAMLGQFTANNQAADVLDDGDVNGFVTKFLNSVIKVARDVGLRHNALYTVTTSAAMPASYGGGMVTFSSGAAIAPTMPLANSVPAGTQISFINGNSGVVTLTRSGTNGLFLNSSTQLSTIGLGFGDTLTLESDGNSNWFAVNGSVQLTAAGVFGASLAASGYKKSPSGDVEQWGVATVPASSVLTVNLPIAFPSAFYGAVATGQQADTIATNISCIHAQPFGLSQLKLQNTYASSSLVVFYRALGR